MQPLRLAWCRAAITYLCSIGSILPRAESSSETTSEKVCWFRGALTEFEADRALPSRVTARATRSAASVSAASQEGCGTGGSNKSTVPVAEMRTLGLVEWPGAPVEARLDHKCRHQSRSTPHSPDSSSHRRSRVESVLGHREINWRLA